MPDINMSLWVVSWRDRGKTSAWRVDDDGEYLVNIPQRHEDSEGVYWQVPVYAHNKMTAIFDAAGLINKEIQTDETVGKKYN